MPLKKSRDHLKPEKTKQLYLLFEVKLKMGHKMPLRSFNNLMRLIRSLPLVKITLKPNINRLSNTLIMNKNNNILRMSLKFQAIAKKQIILKNKLLKDNKIITKYNKKVKNNLKMLIVMLHLPKDNGNLALILAS